MIITDLKLIALIDAACPTCSMRSKFWRECKDDGFEFAFARLVRAGGNAFWLNEARKRYEDAVKTRSGQ